MEDLKNLDESTLLKIHNEYCDKHRYDDEYIHENSSDFLVKNFGSLEESLDAINRGGYSLNEKYVIIDSYGDPATSNNVLDFIDVDRLREHIEEST